MIASIIPWFIVLAIVALLFGLYLGALFGTELYISFYTLAAVCAIAAMTMAIIVVL